LLARFFVDHSQKRMDIQNKPSPQILRKEVKEETKGTKKNIHILSYLFLAAAGIVAYFLLKLNVFHVFGIYQEILQKISLGVFVSALILIGARFAEIHLIKKTKVAYTRYNLTKMVKLMSWLLIMMVGIGFLFKNWYSAAMSLGLVSLILGFALQNPISSFIGWLYILIRQPYHVGDRIQIDTFRGDVVEVNYLDTTLWEFSGDYLTNDLPSGRLIRFPNSLVLASAVYNYSWEKFPYIWNEIPFHVAYESDLKFVEETIKKITKEELGLDMADKIDRFKELVEQTPVNELDIKEYPFISLRINANTWVEIMVTYLVHPKRSTATRTNLIRKILAELNAKKDKVMFPNSNNR
jgi:small-conductance mechanosensitive channel